MDDEDRSSGQAVVLAAVVLATVAVLVLTAVARFGTHTVERSRARTAADAAALAGLAGGRPGAARVAAAHGAMITAWSVDGDEVLVEVRLGDAVADARATDGVD
jgi:hypothetical protein